MKFVLRVVRIMIIKSSEDDDNKMCTITTALTLDNIAIFIDNPYSCYRLIHLYCFKLKSPQWQDIRCR